MKLQKGFKFIVPAFFLLSLAGFFLFFEDGPLSSQAAVDLPLEDVGRVLGVLEQANRLPLAAYNHFNPENYLPENEDRKFNPVRVGGSEILINASSSLIIDPDSTIKLWSFNDNQKRPIASITKIMSALIILESSPDWNSVYKMKKSDHRVGGRAYIYEGEELLVKDLFNLALVSSDNTAIVALISSLGMTEEEFVAKMNKRAVDFGLFDTSFSDATGLSSQNVSTAVDVAQMAKIAFSRKIIKETALKQRYEFTTLSGRFVGSDSTDQLLKAFPENGVKLAGGKTGYISLAGYCFVGVFKNYEGRNLITVVLGAPTDQARFRETKKMADWAFKEFEWQIAN